jgi:hypothetical protein
MKIIKKFQTVRRKGKTDFAEWRDVGQSLSTHFAKAMRGRLATSNRVTEVHRVG